MCNLQSHYYVMGAVDKGPRVWTIEMHSQQRAIAKDINLEIRQFANNVINLQWVVSDYQNQIFKVPDAVIGFDRSQNVDIDVSLLELKNITDADGTRTIIIVKNKAGAPLYQLNGFVMTHDHFNFFDVSLMTDGQLIGLADQVSDSLFLQDGVYSLWSRDVPSPVADHKLPGKNEYGVQPFVMTTSATKPSAGLFSNVAAAQDWWIQRDQTAINIKVYAAGGVGDHFVFVGGVQTTPAPLQIVQGYLSLFGKPLAPPQWAFGWHQCRWGYNSVDKLREVLQGYQSEELPLDGLWNDIDYMDNYRSFTVGKDHGFANLSSFVDDLHNQNLRYVPIVDSGVALRPGYAPYDEARAEGVLIKASNGQDFVGMVWPNDAVWFDFFLPNDKAQDLWVKNLKNFHD